VRSAEESDRPTPHGGTPPISEPIITPMVEQVAAPLG